MKTNLQAGSAQIDITPPLGTHLAGDGAGIHRPGRKALDLVVKNVKEMMHELV